MSNLTMCRDEDGDARDDRQDTLMDSHRHRAMSDDSFVSPVVTSSSYERPYQLSRHRRQLPEDEQGMPDFIPSGRQCDATVKSILRHAVETIDDAKYRSTPVVQKESPSSVLDQSIMELSSAIEEAAETEDSFFLLTPRRSDTSSKLPFLPILQDDDDDNDEGPHDHSSRAAAAPITLTTRRPLPYKLSRVTQCNFSSPPTTTCTTSTNATPRPHAVPNLNSRRRPRACLPSSTASSPPLSFLPRPLDTLNERTNTRVSSEFHGLLDRLDLRDLTTPPRTAAAAKKTTAPPPPIKIRPRPLSDDELSHLPWHQSPKRSRLNEMVSGQDLLPAFRTP